VYFLGDFGRPLERVQGSWSEVDDAASRFGHKSGDAFADALEEAADAFLASAFDWFRRDAGDAVEDAHDEAFPASGETLAEILSPPFVDAFAALALELLVEGERSETLAESAGNPGKSAGCTSDDAGKDAAEPDDDALGEFWGSLDSALNK